MIYPWQTEQWEQLCRAKQQQRLPHALLFTGMKGTGKTKFADCFIRALLCNIEYCNTCHTCRMIEGRAHPNVLWIEPEKAGQAIKIDQIRAVCDFISQSSFQGDYRIVIINPAHNMNASAANALLKTLEEPASGSIMILISDQPSRLPATVLSRCQRVAFSRPQAHLALPWLREHLPATTVDPELLLHLADGAPLAALQLVQDDVLAVRERLFQALRTLNKRQSDPIKCAQSLQDSDPLLILDFLLTWITDLLRIQLGGEVEHLTNKDQVQTFQELCKHTTVQRNTVFMEWLKKLRGQIGLGSNLNKQLVLESIFIQWAYQ